jgi:hypothetical protein
MGVDGYGHLVKENQAIWPTCGFAWKGLEGQLVEGEGFTMDLQHLIYNK